MSDARRFTVRGTVQGVGFRPFVARLAGVHELAGWVLNAPHGVEIHVEGHSGALDSFARALTTHAPPAARIEAIDLRDADRIGLSQFVIRESEREGPPTVRISPDLPVCADCLQEMVDPHARRFEYPYINCTSCGPRFSIVRALPYDRARTTMDAWPLCAACAAEYGDAADRRFHAEPVACPQCGPTYRLVLADVDRPVTSDVIAEAARLLRDGAVVALKGLGGYHLCCDAANGDAVRRLRERKYRKAKPFAVMARDVSVARTLVSMDAEAEAALMSPAAPIVLVPSRVSLAYVAPGHRELGVMLPYAPIHHLLFRAGAPDGLVMTSGNRASEPIAYDDADALNRLAGIADAFLIGERPIARRVEDSVVRVGPGGPMILRRGRGYAPAAVARVPSSRAIVALGGDLKNSVTLLIGGDAIVSQHVGDLDHWPAYEAFRETVRDLAAMYEIDWSEAIVAHDRHPHYLSTAYALDFPADRRVGVQHHRAHVASVLAERGALDTAVVGIAFDGTGYGDDGTIWGGEFFVGSISGGLNRVASLHPFPLPGGDAAARSPIQAAAGVLYGLDDLPDLTLPPFRFPDRYRRARQLAASGLRTFGCTSAGRLFDAAAAILGFTQDIEYEGQAAVWVEQLAWRAGSVDPLPFHLTDAHVDLRPALQAMIERRLAGVDCQRLARAFHETLARAGTGMTARLCDAHGIDTVVVSGGTFQNALLLERIVAGLPSSVKIWANAAVPPNDGGISLGQAALAAAAFDGGRHCLAAC